MSSEHFNAVVFAIICCFLTGILAKFIGFEIGLMFGVGIIIYFLVRIGLYCERLVGEDS